MVYNNPLLDLMAVISVAPYITRFLSVVFVAIAAVMGLFAPQAPDGLATES